MDVIGSTERKALLDNREWFSTFATFYHEMEREFAEAWLQSKNSLFKIARVNPGSDPELWKAAGDELIFFKEISDYRQAYIMLLVWKRTLDGYRDLHSDDHDHFRVKCSAWLAGFPINNSEVILTTKLDPDFDQVDYSDPIIANLRLLDRYYKQQDLTRLTRPVLRRDFVGPSIDLGFRLSAYASERKMPVSIDLAHLIAEGRHQLTPEKLGVGSDEQLKVAYSGTMEMKGVWENADYPVFWIDVGPVDFDFAQEANLLGLNATETDIKRLCEDVYRKQARFIHEPYIKDDEGNQFSEIPPNHAEQLKQLAQRWETDTEREDTAIEALAAQKDKGKSLGESDTALIIEKLKRDK